MVPLAQDLFERIIVLVISSLAIEPFSLLQPNNNSKDLYVHELALQIPEFEKAS